MPSAMEESNSSPQIEDENTVSTADILIALDGRDSGFIDQMKDIHIGVGVSILGRQGADHDKETIKSVHPKDAAAFLRSRGQVTLGCRGTNWTDIDDRQPNVDVASAVWPYGSTIEVDRLSSTF
jgi:hypothetical protein